MKLFFEEITFICHPVVEDFGIIFKNYQNNRFDENCVFFNVRIRNLKPTTCPTVI